MTAPEQLSDSVPRSLSGQIVPATRAVLSFKLAGILDQYPAEDGTRVSKGAVLARLDPTDYQLRWKADQAQFEQLDRELGRMERLLKTGSVTASDRDRVKAARDMALAQRDKSAHDLEETVLRAPFDGLVQQRFSRLHETVGAGTPVLELVDPSRLEVEVPLSDELYRLRASIQSLSVQIEGKALTANILGITPMGDISHLHMLRAELPTQESALIPGQPIEALLKLSRSEGPTHAVPLSALVRRNNQQGIWLWTTQTRTVRFCPLERICLLDAGRAGFWPPSSFPTSAKVITQGQVDLKENQRVEPLDAYCPAHEGYLP